MIMWDWTDEQLKPYGLHWDYDTVPGGKLPASGDFTLTGVDLDNVVYMIENGASTDDVILYLYEMQTELEEEIATAEEWNRRHPFRRWLNRLGWRLQMWAGGPYSAGEIMHREERLTLGELYPPADDQQQEGGNDHGLPQT